ncbi:MAG: CaiB/BaiF CoA transferase family protein [Candidatus Limnocylindria bacterium]
MSQELRRHSEGGGGGVDVGACEEPPDGLGAALGGLPRHSGVRCGNHKVEDPATGGDVGRYVPPGARGTESLYFEAFNRGKRSLRLDLKSDDGQATFRRLAASADAVYSNLRGDQPHRLGLTYDQLRDVNPRIVCVALTGYGRTGARAELPGYDALVQAEAGWAGLTGGPDDPPTKSGLSLADYVAGLVSVLGLMVALFDARRSGEGRDVDTNLYDCALSMLSYPATWHLSAGIATERHASSSHPSIVPFQFFATTDGHVAIASPKEKFFGRLVAAMGLPHLANDDRFTDFDARRIHRKELVGLLADRFREESTDAWVDRLRGVIPIAPVRSLADALDPAELADRGMLAEYEHETFGRVRSVGLPITMSRFKPSYRPAPGLGADDDLIAEELRSLPDRAGRGLVELDG